MQSYQDSKATDLEAEIQEYLHGDGADWASMPLPTSLRDSAIELVNALVRHLTQQAQAPYHAIQEKQLM